MADFIAEWTETELPKEYDAYSNWIMHFDGSKMLAGLGAGVVLTSPTGDTVQYVLQIMYTDSNNAAEYEALLHGLRMAVSMGIKRLEVHRDSNLAISQINGDFDAKDPKMAAYRNAVLKMSARFDGNSTMWLGKTTRRRISSPVLALSASLSHLTSSWKKYLSHPLYGKETPVTIVWTRPQHQIPNTLTQSEALPSK